MQSGTVIATWFVADDASNATFFPQVGSRSDAPETQAVYWRCTAVFYASSLRHNPAARHVFYTNTQVPVVDGIDLAALFARWGVEVVHLPITYRLAKGSVGSWGNQFYIFDVLQHFASSSTDGRLIVLDSDCVWRKPVDAMEREIDRHGALTYLLDGSEHPDGEPINGLSREGLARFVAARGGPQLASAPYFGGEIYAATSAVTARIVEEARRLWPDVAGNAADAPREEAHLLSAIYALQGIAPATANRFIRRMWTTFQHNNLAASDTDLAIWHLPAEKKTGFADLYRQVTARHGADPRTDGNSMGLDLENLARQLGYPRRHPRKFLRDLTLKLREKARL